MRESSHKASQTHFLRNPLHRIESQTGTPYTVIMNVKITVIIAIVLQLNVLKMHNFTLNSMQMRHYTVK